LQTLVDEISNQVIKRIEHSLIHDSSDESSLIFSLRNFCEERCEIELDDLSSKIREEIQNYCDSDFDISNYSSEITDICVDAVKDLTFRVEVD